MSLCLSPQQSSSLWQHCSERHGCLRGTDMRTGIWYRPSHSASMFRHFTCNFVALTVALCWYVQARRTRGLPSQLPQTGYPRTQQLQSARLTAARFCRRPAARPQCRSRAAAHSTASAAAVAVAPPSQVCHLRHHIVTHLWTSLHLHTVNGCSWRCLHIADVIVSVTGYAGGSSRGSSRSSGRHSSRSGASGRSSGSGHSGRGRNSP